MLSLYGLFFLDFNFNVKNKEREKRIDEINILLEFLKNCCTKRTPLLNENWFKLLNKKLSIFNIIKFTANYRKILNFIFEIIQILFFWDLDSNIIKKQLNYIFPQKKL